MIAEQSIRSLPHNRPIFANDLLPVGHLQVAFKLVSGVTIIVEILLCFVTKNRKISVESGFYNDGCVGKSLNCISLSRGL